MPERPLTKRQHDVLQVILTSVAAHGFPPTIREIGLACGMNLSTTYEHVKRLETKGYIARDPKKPRAIQVLRREPEPA